MRRFVTITRELLLLAVLLVPAPTVAFELFDGRFQANGPSPGTGTPATAGISPSGSTS